jgi:hypothetical protein
MELWLLEGAKTSWDLVQSVPEQFFLIKNKMTVLLQIIITTQIVLNGDINTLIN